MTGVISNTRTFFLTVISREPSESETAGSFPVTETWRPPGGAAFGPDGEQTCVNVDHPRLFKVYFIYNAGEGMWSIWVRVKKKRKTLICAQRIPWCNSNNENIQQSEMLQARQNQFPPKMVNSKSVTQVGNTSIVIFF